MLRSSAARSALAQRRVVVRTAAPRDYDAIREVIAAAYEQYEDRLPAIVWPGYLDDLLDLERHAALGEVIVAEVDGQIRGSGTFYPDVAKQGLGWPSGWAGGRGLAVHPDARGLGVARTLLRESERRARAVDAPVFAFHSAPFMTTAIELYQRAGYRRAPEYDVDLTTYYGLPTDIELTIIAFRRDLWKV